MVIKDTENMSNRVENDEEATNESPTDNEVPVKRKRGRPRKPVEEVRGSVEPLVL